MAVDIPAVTTARAQQIDTTSDIGSNTNPTEQSRFPRIRKMFNCLKKPLTWLVGGGILATAGAVALGVGLAIGSVALAPVGGVAAVTGLVIAAMALYKTCTGCQGSTAADEQPPRISPQEQPPSLEYLTADPNSKAIDPRKLELYVELSKQEIDFIASANLDAKIDLERFRAPQLTHKENAFNELANGRKVTCWFWYIFPQIAGLGTSQNAIDYAIRHREEAVAYHQNLELSRCYQHAIGSLIQSGKKVPSVMSELDTLKLWSSLTLFAEATGAFIYTEALNTFFGGLREPNTVKILQAQDRLKK